MKKEEFFTLLSEIDEAKVADAHIPLQPVKRSPRIKWIAAAACFCLTSAIIIGINNRANEIPLSDQSIHVTAHYTNKVPTVKDESALVSLTEEELFTHFNTAIVKGSILDIQNIVLDFNGDKAYRAIAEIKVDKVFRGPCKAGDTISILLPCPIDIDGMWVEDTDTVSAMKIGMTGIFMPMIYDDENSFWVQNNAKLMKKDLAPYGLADGERYLFFETDHGLIFASYAYESIANATTLEEIEAYINIMLEKLT